MPLFTPEMLIGTRHVAEACLSGDGERIAFTVEGYPVNDDPRARPCRELWQVDTGGRRLGLVRDAGLWPRSLAYSPTGTHLAWLASTDASAPTQVWASRPGGRAAPITSSPTSIEAFAWMPDGHTLAYLSREDSTQPLGDWLVLDASARQIRLRMVGLAGGAVATVSPPSVSIHDLSISPDGDCFAVVLAPGPTIDDRIARALPAIMGLDGSWRPLTDGPRRVGSVAWSPDGRSIAWVGGTSVSHTPGGSIWVASSDDGHGRNLTESYRGSATALTWRGGRPGTLVFSAIEGLDHVVRSVCIADGAFEPLVVQPGLAPGLPSLSDDGTRLALIASTPSHPPELWSGRIPEQRRRTLRRLTDLNPDLVGVTLSEQRPIRWRARDNVEIEGILTLPRGPRPELGYPLVVTVHGGPESSDGMEWLGTSRKGIGQLLATRGIATLSPNYRGSTGRGAAFEMASLGDVGGAEYEDVVAGVDHVVEAGFADAGRIGIVGASWGGYMAALGATKGSHRFLAAVVSCGISDWISMAGTSRTGWHEQIAHFGLSVWEEPERFLAASPIAHIATSVGTTPTLILHGANDTDVPIQQAYELQAALQWRGVPVTLVVYPREEHVIAERAHLRDYLNRITDWFVDHLKPSAATATDAGHRRPEVLAHG